MNTQQNIRNLAFTRVLLLFKVDLQQRPRNCSGNTEGNASKCELKDIGGVPCLNQRRHVVCVMCYLQKDLTTRSSDERKRKIHPRQWSPAKWWCFRLISTYISPSIELMECLHIRTVPEMHMRTADPWPLLKRHQGKSGIPAIRHSQYHFPKLPYIHQKSCEISCVPQFGNGRSTWLPSVCSTSCTVQPGQPDVLGCTWRHMMPYPGGGPPWTPESQLTVDTHRLFFAVDYKVKIVFADNW